MDWSLVLVSQGIEPVIEPPGETGGWALVVSAKDSERAFKSLRQYRVENRGWPWLGHLANENFHFDWSCIGWTLVLMVFYWLSSVLSGLKSAGIMDSTKVASGQWWRVFTAMELHADAAHLATNLAIGIVLTGLAMGRFGTWLGLLASLLAGAIGNVASLTLNAGPFHGLGASGMIMGSLGLLSAQSFASVKSGKRSLKYLLGGVAAGLMLFVLLGLAPGTDMAAHLGGFVGGLFLGAGLVRIPPKTLQSAPTRWMSFVVLLLLAGGTWCLALRHN